MDQYGDVFVFQSLSAGVEYWRDILADTLLEKTRAAAIYERSDADVRELEGLSVRNGALRGSPPERVTISENGLRFVVNIVSGHKTGFYLDQRENRRAVANYVRGARVLDMFCYTGGFSLNAGKLGGASEVLGVDTSGKAIAVARAGAELNSVTNVSFEVGDGFEALDSLVSRRDKFDVVILDPPKFTRTRRSLDEALRAYHRINRQAVALIPPGGTLSDYVPFYFTPFSIMMFNIKTGYGGITKRDNKDIIIFVSSIHKLRE